MARELEIARAEAACTPTSSAKLAPTSIVDQNRSLVCAAVSGALSISAGLESA